MPPGATPFHPDEFTVIKRSLDLSLDLTGVFVPRDAQEVRIKPKRYQGDLVIAKSAPAGTRVGKGDLLLQLDTAKIDQQIAAAQNELTLIQANFDKAQADITLGAQADKLAMDHAQSDFAYAQKALKRWDDADGPAFLTASNLHVKQADEEVENQGDELDQLHKMYKSEDLTSITADIVVKRAIRALELAKISDGIAHTADDRATQLEAVGQRQNFQKAVDDQTLAIAQLQATQAQQKVARDTALVTAKVARDDGIQKLDELKKDRESFTVNAVIDGVVVDGSFAHKAWTESDPGKLQPGQTIQADQVVMTVYQPGKLSLILSWPENQLSLFAANGKVEISPVGFPELAYDAALGAMSPMGQIEGADQTFDVVVDLPAVDPRIAPGFKADVIFEGGKRDNVLLVPASAINHRKVSLVKQDGSVPTPVVVGPTEGIWTQIISGINEGDTVKVKYNR